MKDFKIRVEGSKAFAVLWLEDAKILAKPTIYFVLDWFYIKTFCDNERFKHKRFTRNI